MKRVLARIALVLSCVPLSLLAACLSGTDVAQNATVTLFEQISYVKKQTSPWQINGKNPYTRNNVFNDVGINIASHCALIDNALNLDFSFYGLTWYGARPLGAFEDDDRRSRAIIEKLRVMFSISDQVQLEMGKLKPKPGLFFLRSPADLVSQYYGGFKPTRLYNPQMRSAYQPSSWGATLSADDRQHALSLSVVPKLSTIDERYLSSSAWSDNQRGNSSEAWLLSYSSHQFRDHTPGVRVLLGDSQSVALSDSVTWTPQVTFKGEMAFHRGQYWRHLSDRQRQALERYEFPSSLYSAEDKPGVELAVGGEYTADNFSLFGLEYYFQSEGYSRSQWQKQNELLRFLNARTGYDPLDKAFDAYKYLMSSEISNTGNKGMLQRKHYLNAWASLQAGGQIALQPYMVLNLVGTSTLSGLHVSAPLSAINDNLEAFGGLYAALGGADSEFALFGEAVGMYVGLKYYL
ncbi:hypothetical protein OQ483_24430 (plasmid) [Enterobacter bugandensis]|uniref:hypothetical protein n=1 Tax=Enterobacter bugandensis TaxID=881260 RepID=UPI00283AAF16|nr:hypothetical protein [Enterobacter bugandensis]WMU75509.1 hypothetical protein OQ483_24430 [Enterobacter bugandensis]